MSNTLGAIIIEGHVQGLSNTRSLGRMGIPVYVVDKYDCIARHSVYCKKYFKSPNYIEDSFANFLIDLAKQEDIEGWVLVPSNDHAVLTISKFKNQLEEYFNFVVPDLEIVNLIYDKVKLLNLARRVGVPIPESKTIKSTKEELEISFSFPVLTKGRNGLSFYKSTGKKAFLAKDKVELKGQLNFLEEKGEMLNSFTQELIPFDGSNKTVSFTAFCENGEIIAHWTGVKLREHPLNFGTATFTKSTFIDECLLQSETLLRELSYSGVCEVEYLKDPRDGLYKLIEINPRTWLWTGLAKASGVDYANMIYNKAIGKPITKVSADELERYWINPFTDTPFSLLAILKGRLSISKYVRSLFYSNIENALFYKGDLMPAWAFLLKSFSFLKNR